MGRWDNTESVLGKDNANNVMSSTAVVANIDGSVLERLEAILGGGTNPVLGTAVQRTKSDLMDGTTTTVFTIAGGNVLITALYGTIKDAAHAVVTDACKFQVNPTVGSATDLCVTSNLSGTEEGTLISIEGTPVAALDVSSSGNIPNTLLNIIAATGNLTFISGGNDTNATTLQLNLWYFPLDAGATVVAA